MIFNLLKSLRLKQLDKINELQLKYDSTLKHGCIYGLYNKNYKCFDYIG